MKDVFPGDDVAARNFLSRWLDLATKLQYAGVADLLNRWEPYRGLIYFHLLLQKLQSKQIVTATPREAESTPGTERRLHNDTLLDNGTRLDNDTLLDIDTPY